jgi:predicted ribonuclease toxin of YeeF-YezG toxin-antitoxin module
MCPHIYNKEENESYKKIQSNWLYNILDKEDKLAILQTRRPKYLAPGFDEYKKYINDIRDYSLSNPNEQILSI